MLHPCYQDPPEIQARVSSWTRGCGHGVCQQTINKIKHQNSVIFCENYFEAPGPKLVLQWVYKNS